MEKEIKVYIPMCSCEECNGLLESDYGETPIFTDKEKAFRFKRQYECDLKRGTLIIE